jgi:hypothetical protein
MQRFLNLSLAKTQSRKEKAINYASLREKKTALRDSNCDPLKNK